MVNASDCRGGGIRTFPRIPERQIDKELDGSSQAHSMRKHREAFLLADNVKRGLDLSYKTFLILEIYPFLRCLANMFYSQVLGLNSSSHLAADKLCKALQHFFSFFCSKAREFL